MSEELHPYNDFFKKKLENHESEVPNDLFESLMRKRTQEQPSDASYNDFFQNKLGTYESSVPNDLFDSLIRQREGSDEQPSDAPLRERITEHSTAVPDHIFNSVIAERERRRRALIWRFAAASLLFLSAYLWFLNRNTTSINLDSKSENPVDISNEKTQATQNIKDNADAATASAQGNRAVNNSANTEGVQSAQNSIFDNQSPRTEGDVFRNKNKNLITNNLVIAHEKQSKNNTVSTTALTNLTPVDHFDSKTADAQNTVSNSANYLTNSSATQQTIIPTFSNVSNSTTAAVSEPNNLIVESGALEAQNSSAFNAQLSSSDSKTLTLGIQNLNPSFDNLSIFKVKNIALPNRELKNPCADPGNGCPTFGKKRNRGGGEKSIFIDVYGAPEYAFRRLSENLPEKTKYLQARDTIESPWYAFSAGVRASLVFESGLALRTGVIYAQTNETAVFDSLGIGKKITTETYVPRTGGGQDTIRKTEITSGIFRTMLYNRYRSIDIPLQIGFEFPVNDYWSFSVNGGANFNISAWRKADILGENNARQDVSSGFGASNPVFRNSLGLSISGSVAAYRQLTGNLQLVIEPSVRHYLQPITRSDYALKQAYTNAGLIVGLRLRL